MYETKVRRVGNSLGATLPVEVLTALDWKEGDTIHFAASNQTLVCRKMSAKARETA